jgi:hypothetical protein
MMRRRRGIEEVFELDVAVDYAVGVEVLDCEGDLEDGAAGGGFGEEG